MKNRNIIEQFTNPDGEVDMLAVIAERQRRAREGKWKTSPEAAYKQYEKSAIKRKKEFKLSLTFFKLMIADPCHYCGEVDKPRGLDRVNPKLGYTRDNVVPCCGMCNHMKFTYNSDDFLKQCEHIVSFNKHRLHYN